MQEIEKCYKTIDKLTQEADQLKRSANDWNMEMLEKEIQRRKRKAFLLETEGIRKLIDKLGEIRTPQLPALDNGDRSVQR